MPDSLQELEAERSSILRQFGSFGDLRGRPPLRKADCAKADDPGHDPQIRLIRKVDGKTVAEFFASPAACRKAQGGNR